MKFLSEKWSGHLYGLLLCWISVSLLVSLKWCSIGIILLTLVWVLSGFGGKERFAFIRHPYFWLSLALFLLYVLGWVRSEDKSAAAFALEKKMSLVLLPAIMLSMKPLSQRWLQHLFSVFVGSTLIFMLLAFICSGLYFLHGHSSQVFFYHRLVQPLGLSAITASCFCFISFILLFYISDVKGVLRFILALFFLGSLLMLASKMMLVLLLLIGLVYLIKGRHRRLQLLMLLTLVFLMTFTFFTNNPVQNRFSDLSGFSFSFINQPHYTAEDYFDGLSLRAVFIRFTCELLTERKSWILGLGTGDAEAALKQKIAASGMYTGKGLTDMDIGYLEYSFHNQYLQELAESGLLGLIFLLAWLLYAFKIAIRRRNFWMLSILVVFTVGSLSEAWLELQIGLVLFLVFVVTGIRSSSPKIVK